MSHQGHDSTSRSPDLKRRLIAIFSYSREFLLSFPAWRRGIFFIGPLLVYAAVIFYGSSQSQWLLEPPNFFSADKIYHVLEYSIFGILLARVFRSYEFPHSWEKKMVAVLVISLLYGLSDELHQQFVPGRCAAFGDLLADTIGGGIGGFVFLKFRKKTSPTD